MPSQTKNIIKDVPLLNRFSTASDHRMVRATIEINAKQESHRMIENNKFKPWIKPINEPEFEQYINNNLQQQQT